MLGINMNDVITTLGLIQGHLIALGVVLVLAIIVTIAAIKIKKPLKGLVRGSSWVAFVVALVIVLNLILTGPLYGVVSMAFRSSGDISEDSITTANRLCEEISEEGFVLLKNDGILPLSGEVKLNTFGWSSTNPVYGGTGSGSLSGLYETVSLLKGLENAGIQYNADLVKFYQDFRAARPGIGMMGQDWTVPEPSMAEYEAKGIFDGAKAYSDTALIVISRSGGEGADLPTSLDPNVPDTFNDDGKGTMFSQTGLRYSEYPEDLDASKSYLEPTTREIAMIEKVTSEFDNVIVVINASNAMELGWLYEYPSIKAAILAPGPGQTGFNALGSIITGKVNPSGRTIDTYVADLTEAPNFNNIGEFQYTNLADVSPMSYGFPVTPNFVNYVEGIYVGYRWYETAAAEGVIDYDKAVVFPFGYGLSYTTFTQEMGAISESNGTLSFDVKVTNTGSVAGKDVVEVYFNPPYTNGGIEKSVANLVAFAKTGVLQPGASETVKISFKAEDMASFDYKGAGCYVLEAGDYVISINKDSHNVIDSKTYNVPTTITYNESNKRSSDAEAATSLFGYAAGDVTYLSRENGFANYAEATAAPTNFEMSDTAKAGFYNHTNYDPTQFNNASDVMPTTGAKNGLTLNDMKGKSYDDAQWEKLLDQLTVEDMVQLIGVGGYQSVAIDSVGKTQQVDCDGPASINNNFTGKASIGFPAGVVIAATWNVDLAKAFGQSIGKMADEMDVSGWYAPAMNIHRSAFAGRNFEYYSEDGFISGKMAANAILGAAESGVYAFMKHFALNDQETHRTDMLCTWTNEQAMREIYLRPFELSVKEGHCTAVMSAFNYIGNKYAAATTELQNSVLRGEWGFRGMVLTDYFGGYGYQDADILVRNGNDFCLTPQMTEYSEMTDKTSATSVLAMRQASKNILYTTANSRAYGAGASGGLATWEIIRITCTVVVLCLCALWEFLLVKKYLKASKAK
ncbi:MAG: glycoside hydrolase family 3 C-terminal domain-containing protein [Oscillospiraceae bacterium]|nr:glycoside hydrolase family 3 C-terminal domain-containing protein [Oscillospiraceae bacterium]